MYDTIINFGICFVHSRDGGTSNQIVLSVSFFINTFINTMRVLTKLPFHVIRLFFSDPLDWGHFGSLPALMFTRPSIKSAILPMEDPGLGQWDGLGQTY